MRSGSRPAKLGASAPIERLHHRLDRELAELAAEILARAAARRRACLRRVARRHRHAMHAVGAECLDRERHDERRVDATRDADDDVAEPVLGHVVVQAQLERESHLLELGSSGARFGCSGSPSRSCTGPARSPARPEVGRSRRKRAAPYVAQPPPDRLDRLDVDDEQAFLETGCPRDDLAFVVDQHRMAVEDQLVLAPDRIAEGDEARVVACPVAQHLLTLDLLADVERRRRDVRDQLRARERHVGRRRARLPDVLAHRRRRPASRRS